MSGVAEGREGCVVVKNTSGDLDGRTAGRTSERAMVLWRADWSAKPVIEGGPFLGSTLGRPARRIVVGSCLAPFAIVAP